MLDLRRACGQVNDGVLIAQHHGDGRVVTEGGGGNAVFLPEGRQGEQQANGRGGQPVEHPDQFGPGLRRGEKPPFNSRRWMAWFP